MLVALVPLWVIGLLFIVNLILAIILAVTEETEDKTDWRQQQAYKDRVEAGWAGMSVDTYVFLRKVAESSRS